MPTAAEILLLPAASRARFIKADDDGLSYYIPAGQPGSTATLVPSFRGMTASQKRAARAALGLSSGAEYFHGSRAGLQAFARALEGGHSAAIAFVGDSLYYSSDGLPRRLATALAARYPSARVEYRVANAAGTALDTTVVQAGSDRQHWYFASPTDYGVFMHKSAERITPAGTAQLSFECEISVDAGSLSSGKPVANIFLNGYGSGAAPAYMVLTTAARVEVYFVKADGTWPGDPFTGNLSPSAVAGGNMVAGTKYKIRVDVLANNGSGGRTVSWFYSTDSGANWISLGSTTNGAATTIGVQATYGYWIGHYGGNPTDGVKYYAANVLIGTNREPILPDRIDEYKTQSGQTSNIATLQGAQTIYIDAIAQNGANLSGLGDSWLNAAAGDALPANAAKLVIDRNPEAVVVASSHNETGVSATWWAEGFETLKTLLHGRYARNPQIIMSTQNPKHAADPLARQHSQRQRDLLAIAASLGHPLFDMHQLYLDNPSWAAQWMQPAVDPHPNSAGYAAVTDAFIQAIFA